LAAGALCIGRVSGRDRGGDEFSRRGDRVGVVDDVEFEKAADLYFRVDALERERSRPWIWAPCLVVLFGVHVRTSPWRAVGAIFLGSHLLRLCQCRGGGHKRGRHTDD